MQYNVKCSFCGNLLHRNFTQQTKSKSGFYFCNKFCKSIFWQGDELYTIPKDNPLFDAIKKCYTVNRNPEYLTGIYIIKIDPKYINTLGHYIITASARVYNNSRLVGKTPKDMENIRNNFSHITILDINSLPELQEDLCQNWKRIKLKYWNDKDITYRVE